MKPQPITSKNLLHVFKKKLVNAGELNNYLKNNPEANRRIGFLPIDFFSNIPETNKAQTTQNIGDIFEKFSIDTGIIEEHEEIYLYGIKNATQEMVSALKKVLNRDDIETSYIDSGSFKNCQRIKIGNFAYALTTFKKYPLFDIKGYFRESHGKGNEPQNIFTVYKRFSHGRICKPFFANLSAEMDEGGFILSKFIDAKHDSKKDLGMFMYNRSFLKNIDPIGNSINGIFIEAGGFTLNKKYIKNDKIRNQWKKFAECLDNNNKLLLTTKANKIQDILFTAIEEVEPEFQHKFLHNIANKYGTEERKIAKKLIRHFIKIRELKNEAIKLNLWNDVQKILKEDFMNLYPFDVYSVEFSEKEDLDEIYANYPRLLAKELEISNIPSLKDLLLLLDEHGAFIEFDFKKYYTDDDFKDLFTNHYDAVKNLYSFQDLQKYIDFEF